MTHFFNYTAGGYPLGPRPHIFWFYSHPAVSS